MALFLSAGPAFGADEPPVEIPKWPDCKSLVTNPDTRAEVQRAYLLTPKVREWLESGVPPEAPGDGLVPKGLQSTEVRLRHEVVIEVDRLDNLLRRRECAASAGAKKSIVLYLDGRPLPEVIAQPPVDPLRKFMIFPLKRTEKSREVWTHLLGSPELDARRVAVSIGIEDEFAIPSKAHLDLEVVPGKLAFCLLIGFLVLVVGFLWLALKSGLLRDTTSPVSANNDKSWSLARVQAAWWFFIILLSYVFIGIITGDFSTTITGTTLVLVAIAAGTTLTSTVIDKGKDTPRQRDTDAAAVLRIEREIDALNKSPESAAQENQERLAAKESQLMKLRGHNERFLIDILSDANGVSFHRFQIAIWTFVLGGVFVCAVYAELAMPQFSETLLGLMGLSAGTFVAMKNTEADTPKKDLTKAPPEKSDAPKPDPAKVDPQQ